MPAASPTSERVTPTPTPRLTEDAALGGWRLPSGEDLLTFALAAGLAANPLLGADTETEVPAENTPGRLPAGSSGRTR